MKKRWMLALAGLVCCFYLSTLRRGQGWMDDYAQYVLHASNIAGGRPYKIPGYLFNPAYPYTGPETYPPVFPLLLAPVYRAYGFSPRVMKAETSVVFAAFLCVLFLIFRETLSGWQPLVLAGLIGLNPVFWKFKDYLYSEYVFLFFSFAALYVFGRARAAEDAGGRWAPPAFGAGLLLYLAYGTRSAGALAGAAFMLSDFLNGKKPSKTLLAVCGTALCLAAAQNLTLHCDAVYVGQARSWFAEASFFSVLLRNARDYPGRFALLFENGYAPVSRILLTFAVVLSAGGFLARVKEKLSPLEIYALINLLFLLACPAADGLRYGFMLVPLIFYYAFCGWAAYGNKPGPSLRLAGPGLVLILLLSYAGVYSKAQYGSLTEGTANMETVRLFAYLRGNTKPSDVVIFRKPRTLLLYTGRSSSMYHLTGDDSGLLSYFKKINASFLVAGEIFPEDRTFLLPFVDRHPGFFRQVYSNPGFRVYKISIK